MILKVGACFTNPGVTLSDFDWQDFVPQVFVMASQIIDYEFTNKTNGWPRCVLIHMVIRNSKMQC